MAKNLFIYANYTKQARIQMQFHTNELIKSLKLSTVA